MNIQQEFLDSVVSWLIETGLKLAVSLAILIIGFWVTKLIVKQIRKSLLKTKKLDETAVSFISSVLRVVFMIIIIFTALGQLVEISSMVTTLGAVGLTASFALQGSLGNFVSGIQVIFSKPFVAGDFLYIGDFTGTVKTIDVLNTKLVTPDNKEIIVPNSKMISDIVVNYSSQKFRRIDLSYGIAYSSNIDKAKELVQNIIEKNELILKEPEYVVAVGKLNDSSVEIVVQVWTLCDDYWNVYFNMQETVKKCFDENSIEIPFPQLSIHSK